MKIAWVIGGIIAALLGGSAYAAEPPGTRFECVRLDKNYATVARRGTRTTGPIIVWNTEIGLWNAWERCRVVNERLSSIIAANQGSFSNLYLTHGRINGTSVICVVPTIEGVCTSQNLLLTLRRSDRNQEQAILEKMVKSIGTQVSGVPLQQSGTQSYALLGEALENQLGSSSQHF